MGPLLGPLVYLYTGPTMEAPSCIYLLVFIWVFMCMGPLCIWVWFFINKNMIKIEK